MLSHFKKIIISFILTIFIYSCNNISKNELNESEIKNIAKTIDSCIGWFKDKDFELLFSVVAHDSNYLSIHPTNRIVRGFEEFKKNSEIFKNPEFVYKRHELKDLKIKISKSGDIAWFYCILDDLNEWQGKPANWENTRWTGVLERRYNRWVIVQQHFSFPASN
jgi:hypothetical protein